MTDHIRVDNKISTYAPLFILSTLIAVGAYGTFLVWGGEVFTLMLLIMVAGMVVALGCSLINTLILISVTSLGLAVVVGVGLYLSNSLIIGLTGKIVACISMGTGIIVFLSIISHHKKGWRSFCYSLLVMVILFLAGITIPPGATIVQNGVEKKITELSFIDPRTLDGPIKF